MTARQNNRSRREALFCTARYGRVSAASVATSDFFYFLDYAAALGAAGEKRLCRYYIGLARQVRLAGA